jgi:hypothetical protein
MNFLNRLPVWVFIGAGIIVGYLLYRWYKGRKPATSTASSVTLGSELNAVSNIVKAFWPTASAN